MHVDRISFISGLSDNGNICREYINTHYEIIQFLYNLIGHAGNNDIFIKESNKDSLLVEFLVKSRGELFNNHICSYLKQMNGVEINGRKINIEIINNTNSIIVKFSTVLE